MISQPMIGTGFGSLAFLDEHIVVGAGPNSNQFLRVDFSNPQSPQGLPGNPLLPIGLVLDADPNSHTVVVASTRAPQVILFDKNLNVIGSADSGLPLVASVALKGEIALLNSAATPQFALIDFSTSPPTVMTSTTFNNGLGVATVAFDGEFGAFGSQLGTPGVTFFDLRGVIGGAQPRLISQLGAVIPGQITSMKMQTLPVLSTASIKAVPTSLDFGDVLVGQSLDHTVSISNPGNDSLVLRTIQTLDPQQFKPKNFNRQTVLTIAPNTSAPLTVRFMPMAVGQINGSLTMTTNVMRMQNFTVPLSGTGDMPVPAIAANPPSLDFGTVPNLTPPPTLTVQIVNNGSAPLNVDTIQTSDNHFTASAAALAAIPPGASAPLMVTYMSPDVGQFNADLRMNTNDPMHLTFHVPLSAKGVTGPGVIQGHVKDSSMSPIPDATVLVGSTQLATDSQGFFTLTVDPGNYDVVAVQSGFTPWRQTVTVPALTTVTLEITLTQPSDFTVKGQITDRNRNPIPGATVRLTSGAPIPAIITTTTDSMGLYSITENPGSWDGDYGLDVWAAGYEGMSDSFPQIQSGAILTRNYMLSRKGIITGQVTDTTGTPLGGALVMVGTGVPILGSPSTFQFSANTDSTEHYSIIVDPPRSYNVVAAQDFFEDSDPVVVAVSLDATTTLNFALVRAAPGSIAGTVTDSESQDTIDRATVEAIVEDPTSESRSTQTGADGTYTLSDVLSGRRQVVASARRYSSETRTVRVIAGRTVPGVDFALNPNPPPGSGDRE
jgi:hypothetical protein